MINPSILPNSVEKNWVKPVQEFGTISKAGAILFTAVAAISIVSLVLLEVDPETLGVVADSSDYTANLISGYVALGIGGVGAVALGVPHIFKRSVTMQHQTIVVNSQRPDTAESSSSES